jgi:hypothetical protein
MVWMDGAEQVAAEVLCGQVSVAMMQATPHAAQAAVDGLATTAPRLSMDVMLLLL